jgi:hypothetical protein
MELLDLPVEILLEILSKLDQETVHSSMALVCKRFLQLTRSPQLLKCVKVGIKSHPNDNPYKSLLVMLHDNKHLEKLILDSFYLNVFEILKVVAPHGSLKHLEVRDIHIPSAVEDREAWIEVFFQICAKLTTFKCTGEVSLGFDCLAPLANAKNLTTLKSGVPTSETFRQMADNYTGLQNLRIYGWVDCEENSDLAYFLEKQSQTLTSLRIFTRTKIPMPAISKCRNLKKLWLDLGRGRGRGNRL